MRRLLGGYHEPRLYAGQVALVGHESTFAYLDEVLGLGTPTTVRYALDDAGLVALLYRLPEEVAASPVEVKGCVAYVGTGHVVTDPDPVFLPGVWLPTTGGTWAPRRVDS